MDGERKVNLEGIPLNAESSTNIYLNTGLSKMCAPNAAVIQLKSNEKNTPHDVGLHINTTLSIASSKKVKLLFILNFLLSVVCIIISCSVVFYYWNEMISMRRQLDTIKEQLEAHNIHNYLGNFVGDTPGPSQQKLVITGPRFETENRGGNGRSLDSLSAGRKYYVENLEGDLHFTNSKNKDRDIKASEETGAILRQGVVIAHFTGGGVERNLGSESVIGPWMADDNSSSKDSRRYFDLLDHKLVKVQEDGLYLIYAQIVYVTSSPKYFTMWSKNLNHSRLLTTCASGDVSSPRAVRNSQLSCAVQTVARLRKDDVLNFAQREKNSTVNLRPGESYFGFVRLGS